MILIEGNLNFPLDLNKKKSMLKKTSITFAALDLLLFLGAAFIEHFYEVSFSKLEIIVTTLIKVRKLISKVVLFASVILVLIYLVFYEQTEWLVLVLLL